VSEDYTSLIIGTIILVAVVFAAAIYDGKRDRERGERFAEMGCNVISNKKTGKSRLSGRIYKREYVTTYDCQGTEKIWVNWK